MKWFFCHVDITDVKKKVATLTTLSFHMNGSVSYYVYIFVQETRKFSATIVGYFHQYVEWVKTAVSVPACTSF